MPYKDLAKRNLSSAQRRRSLGEAMPPDGFAPVRVTTGPDGNVVAVRSVPEGDEKHISPIVLENHEVKFVTTLLDSEGAIKLQYVRGEPEKARLLQIALDRIDARFDAIASGRVPTAPVPLPAWPLTRYQEDLQATLLLGDPHMGMLAWHRETGVDFDIRIAEKHMNMAVDLLLERAPKCETLVVANLGDFFHAEDEQQRTPKGGNKLDVDGRSGKILDIGFGCLERCVLRGLQKYKQVKVICLPGNHDPRLSRVLTRWLRTRFMFEPRVTVMANDDPFVYHTFGKNLFMFYHGHDVKVDELAPIMSVHEGGVPWGQHQHRWIYTGHIHHLQRKEYRGVIWESSRTMAPSDYWHHSMGYRSGRGMRMVTHHREFGAIREDLIGSAEVELALQLVESQP
jgi:metallophosphoesterase superfamily enzyme